MSPRANVSDRTEATCVGNLDANLLVRDDHSRPDRDNANETQVQTAARKALERQEKERRGKSRKLNQYIDAASEVTRFSARCSSIRPPYQLVHESLYAHTIQIIRTFGTLVPDCCTPRQRGASNMI